MMLASRVTDFVFVPMGWQISWRFPTSEYCEQGQRIGEWNQENNHKALLASARMSCGVSERKLDTSSSWARGGFDDEQDLDFET